MTDIASNTPVASRERQARCWLPKQMHILRVSELLAVMRQ